MGKYSNGLNGPFSGKVGNVVGSSWMGTPVIRSIPSRRRTHFSPLELQQQAKFALMSKFLKPLIPFLNRTFKLVAVRMSGFNKAYSYNVKNAISGVHPDFKIDYSMLLLSRGDLPNAALPSVASPVAGQLTITWTDNSGKGKATDTDQAFAAVYDEESGRWITVLNLSKRSAGVCTMDVADFNGKAVQTYLGFFSEDEKDVSDTVYLGEVEVTNP